MGHHHGHPLTGSMELRPNQWSATLKVSLRDPKELRTDTDQSFLINQTDLACIHTYIHIHHIQVPYNSPLSYSQENPYQPIILESWIWNSTSYHYHATLIPTLSCLMSNSYQTHHYNSMNHLIQISYSHHVKTHESQLIHHPIHKGHSIHILKNNIHTSIVSTFEIKENIKASHILAQLLTQAERFRSGEKDSRSGELRSPRRELDFQYSGLTRILT